MDEDKFKVISDNLSPERPIRSTEFLRGRVEDLENIVRELRYFHSTVFIYGYRGVGKTSLARTAAQLVTSSDREHVYVACSPGARMLQVFREIAEELLKVLFRAKSFPAIAKTVEFEFSLTPSIRASFEKRNPSLEEFHDSNGAVRIIKELDDLLTGSESTVVILDELEELNDGDRTDLAYLIKQIGDQEFGVKFILVGIAENVHELIGAHESVPRYLKEISLSPLSPQHLMDIVKSAADAIDIHVDEEILYRVAIIGNGYPHFSHLMGKALLTEAVIRGVDSIDADVYKAGVSRAVSDSIQELKMSYEAATQRGEDYFKHLIWALANSDIVDVRIDEWIREYHDLVRNNNFTPASDAKLRNAIGNFSKESYGKIIKNTPARYGSAEMRYRYKRFSNTLMRGHVRLQAEHEGVKLGKDVGP